MFSFKFTQVWNPTPYEGYYFLHSYPSTDNKTVLQPTGEIYSCREYFIRVLRNRISNYAANDVRTKKAYALVTLGRPPESSIDTWQAKLDQHNEIALHVLNSFERKYKWPLTRVYPVKLIGKRKIPFAFFIGGRKWTMSPYLMSIWTLGIRMGRGDWFARKKILTLSHDTLVKQLANPAKASMGDLPQVKKTIPHWGFIMENYHSLFGGRRRKDNWSKKPLGGYDDRPEGVVKLVTGSTKHKELYKKYCQLKEAQKSK